MSETLRKYPMLIIMDRQCTRKFELSPTKPGCDGIILYLGDTIWLSVYALHHDPRYFSDP